MMNRFLLVLSVLACMAANQAVAGAFPVCVSLAPTGICGQIQYDSKGSATWIGYDCGTKTSKQTTATYKKAKGVAKTRCDDLSGCDAAVDSTWDAFDWDFNLQASTGTLTTWFDGFGYVYLKDAHVLITKGACSASAWSAPAPQLR